MGKQNLKFRETDMGKRILKFRETDYHWTITTTLRSFISCIDQKAAFKEYNCDGNDFEKYFDVEFYANGYCDQSEGYVSIIFERILKEFYLPQKISCVASVIDASGNKRFMRSYVTASDGNVVEALLTPSRIRFGFDKFIQRSTLLSDSSELMPDDSLTLHIEMDYKLKTSDVIHIDNSALWLHTDGRDSGIYFFRREEQEEFKESFCKRYSSKKVSIPPEEENTFSFLFRIIGEDNFIVCSGDEIYDLYLFADKYDMQLIIEICHQLLFSMVLAIRTSECSSEILEHSEESIQKYFELAERFTNDIALRKILTVYSDIQRKFGGFGCNLIPYDVSDLESKWSCEFFYDIAFETYSIHFNQIKSADPLMDIFR